MSSAKGGQGARRVAFYSRHVVRPYGNTCEDHEAGIAARIGTDAMPRPLRRAGSCPRRPRKRAEAAREAPAGPVSDAISTRARVKAVHAATPTTTATPVATTSTTSITRPAQTTRASIAFQSRRQGRRPVAPLPPIVEAASRDTTAYAA